MTDKILKTFLPLYIRFCPSFYWLALWSAPITPTKKGDYWKALRITLRSGECHSKLVKAIKQGII